MLTAAAEDSEMFGDAADREPTAAHDSDAPRACTPDAAIGGGSGVGGDGSPADKSADAVPLLSHPENVSIALMWRERAVHPDLGVADRADDASLLGTSL
eukprot:4533390-Prymnesium_polylepis.1